MHYRDSNIRLLQLRSLRYVEEHISIAECIEHIRSRYHLEKGIRSYHTSAPTATLASHPTEERKQSDNVGVQDSRSRVTWDTPSNPSKVHKLRKSQTRTCLSFLICATTNFSRWAFSFFVLTVWNKLPSDLHRPSKTIHFIIYIWQTVEHICI